LNNFFAKKTTIQGVRGLGKKSASCEKSGAATGLGEVEKSTFRKSAHFSAADRDPRK